MINVNSIIITCILWFVKANNLVDLFFRLSTRYDIAVSEFRRLEKLIFKCKKIQLVINFFNCDALNIFPKFLQIKPKLAPVRDNITELNKVAISSHIKFLNKKLKSNKFRLRQLDKIISSRLSWFRMITLKLCIFKHLNKSLLKIKDTQLNKLSKLWLNQRSSSPDCVINLSDHSLTILEREALRFGLKYPITPSHFEGDLLKFELEKSVCSISNLNQDTKQEIIHSFKEFEENSKRIIKEKSNRILHRTLRKLSQNKNIKICSFDKGQGIVILNSFDYSNKLNKILSDKSKFRIISVPSDIKKHPVCVEENKIIRYLNKYVKNKICDSVFRKIIPSDTTSHACTV